MNSWECFYGVTIRDFFAAHAPKEPTFEFDVKMRRPKPKTEAYPDDPELLLWEIEYNRQRAVQWPWIYADAVLRARGE